MNYENVDEYQLFGKATAIFPEESGIAYCTIKLAGEVGEFSEKIGKLIRDKSRSLTDQGILDHMSAEDERLLIKELGDICWYVSMLAYQLGYDMSEVLEINVEKLRKRRLENKISGSGDER